MNIFRPFIACALLFCSLPAFAEKSDLSDTDKHALQLALDRGLDIYRYDQAAWHVTDAMREDIKDLENSGIRGWVVTESNDGLLTTFWKPEGNSYIGAYSAIWNRDGVSKRQILSGEAAQLSGQQIRLIQARSAVDASKLERCSQSPFNTVVLPPVQANGPILVYLLTPQTSNDAIPMGGHYRFEVKDGKVAGQRSFSKSCLSLATKSKEKGATLAGIGTTHLLDPIPTELHFFSVFAAKLPIYITTMENRKTWVAEISDGQPRVRPLESKE